MKHFLILIALFFGHFAQATSSDCGTQGTLAQRITDCSANTELQIPGFFLVVATKGGYLIYQSKTTGNVWADLSAGDMNHQDALEYCKSEIGMIEGLEWRVPFFSEMSHELEFKNLPRSNHWLWSADEILPDEFFIFNPHTRPTLPPGAPIPGPTASTIGWVNWGVRCVATP